MNLPLFLLILIFHLILLWVKILCLVSIFLIYLRLIRGLRYGLSWKMFHLHLRRMCIWFGVQCSDVSVGSSWLLVDFCLLPTHNWKNAKVSTCYYRPISSFNFSIFASCIFVLFSCTRDWTQGCSLTEPHPHPLLFFYLETGPHLNWLGPH